MTSTVADKTAAVMEMEPDWELSRALMGGTRAMRKAGKTHLPQWPNEDHNAYACRLATAVLFPAYQRTVQTLTGKPFSKPITMGEDVPPQLREWAQDIDLQGRNLDAFAADAMESALGYGVAGILVDYPMAEGVRTMADERAAGLRPYWIQIQPWQVLGWVAARVQGSWSLLQLRLMECVEEPDGPYAVKSVDQVRVLEPGKWATYRQNDKKEWILFEEGATSLSYIPYVPVYGARTGFMTGKPPLIEVAHLNVAHWQSASDQQTILHVARVPILTVIGVDQDDKWSMTVGASAAVKLPMGGDMKFVEHTGKAIDAGASELNALEERMRQAGAELLVIAPGKITATQVATENAVGMCALQRITQGLEDALDQALQITADWVGEAQGGHVTLFNDYGAASLQEASADLLLKANQAGKLSDETFHSELQRRGILSNDVAWDDEKDRLDEQGPALGMMGEVDPLAGEPVEGAAAPQNVDAAKGALDAAIALHEKHMNGTAPTTGADGEKSQMLMMDQMKAARDALALPGSKPMQMGASNAQNENAKEAPPASQAEEARPVDLGPLVEALRASADKPAPTIDWAPLVDALKSQTAPQIMVDAPDFAPLVDAIGKMVPAPMDMAPLVAAINAKESSVTMEADMRPIAEAVAAAIAAIPAPVVNIPQPAAPTINVQPAEQQLAGDGWTEIEFIENSEGVITGARKKAP